MLYQHYSLFFQIAFKIMILVLAAIVSIVFKVFDLHQHFGLSENFPIYDFMFLVEIISIESFKIYF